MRRRQIEPAKLANTVLASLFSCFCSSQYRRETPIQQSQCLPWPCRRSACGPVASVALPAAQRLRAAYSQGGGAGPLPPTLCNSSSICRSARRCAAPRPACSALSLHRRVDAMSASSMLRLYGLQGDGGLVGQFPEVFRALPLAAGAMGIAGVVANRVAAGVRPACVCGV